ncbi:MAG TPA: hypothetical protein VFS00_06545, partial [Polyangiaceae bacterium]|nr:hypothetical protein [Polyangiaceae bacterium]
RRGVDESRHVVETAFERTGRARRLTERVKRRHTSLEEMRNGAARALEQQSDCPMLPRDDGANVRVVATGFLAMKARASRAPVGGRTPG